MSVEEKRPLPSGWRQLTLGDVAEYINGRAFKPSEWEISGLPIIRIQNLTNHKISFNYYSRPVKDKYYISNGDLLISWSATLDAFLWNRGPAILNQHIFLVRERPDLIRQRYLYYFVRGHLHLLMTQTHGSGMQHITKGKFVKIPIPLAPIPEQKRIVAEIEKQFTRLDQAVASLKRAQAKLQRYKASVLKAACEGRLVPQNPNDEPAERLLQRILTERRRQWEEQEWQKLVIKAQKKVAQTRRKAASRPARLTDLQPEEWQDLPEPTYAPYLPKNDKWKEKYKEPAPPDTAELPSLPAGWGYAILEQITSPIRVICYGILMPKEHIPDGIPYVKVRDIKNDKILIESLNRTKPEIAEKYARASLKSGDVLLSIRGTYGRVAEVPIELEGGNITQDTARLDVPRSVNRQYVAWHLRSPVTQNFFKRVARGVAVKGVNIGDVKLTPLLLPPRPEQERIVAEVERRLSVVAANGKAIAADLARAKRLRQSILKQAFSGQLVVRSQRSSETSEV